MRPALLSLAALLPHLLSSAPLDDVRTLFEQRRVPEARAILESVVKADPANADAWALLGTAQLRMNQREVAVETLAKALELAPEQPRVLSAYGEACMARAGELGMSFKAMGMARKGRDALEKSLRLDPNQVDPRYTLMEYYRRAPGIAGGSMDKALAQAAEIRRLDPIRGTVATATLLTSEKRYDDALAACDALLAEQPDLYAAHYAVGRLAAESGRFLDRGAAALRRCLQLAPGPNDPNHAAAHWRLGLILEKSGDVPGARAAFQASVAADPAFARAAEALKRLDKEKAPAG